MASFDRMLASDAERIAIVERLQKAAAEGRLSLGDLSYRASRAFAARTWAELDRLVGDLPPSWDTPPAAPSPFLPFLTLGIGVASTPFAFAGPMGAALGVLGVLAGVYTLYDGNRFAARERRVTVAGILVSLLVLVVALAR